MTEGRRIITPDEYKKEQEKETSAELLFRVENVKSDDLPYIRMWPRELGIDEQERARREEIMRDIENQVSLLDELVPLLQERQISFAEISKNQKFNRATKTLFALLQQTDLKDFLSSHQKEKENEEELEMFLPSSDFDPTRYTAEEIMTATDDLARKIEALGENETKETQNNIGLVADYIRTGKLREYALKHLEDGSLSGAFNLSWIKADNKEVWTALTNLVHTKHKLLKIILGDTESYDYTLGSETDTKDRATEMRTNLANALHIALARSVSTIFDEAAPEKARAAEETALKELYGPLAAGLDYRDQAENIVLQAEVAALVLKLKLELKPEELKLFTQGYALLRATSNKDVLRAPGFGAKWQALRAQWKLDDKLVGFDWQKFCSILGRSQKLKEISSVENEEEIKEEKIIINMLNVVDRLSAQSDTIENKIKIVDKQVNSPDGIYNLVFSGREMEIVSLQNQSNFLQDKASHVYKSEYALLGFLNKERKQSDDRVREVMQNSNANIKDLEKSFGIFRREVLDKIRELNASYFKRVRSSETMWQLMRKDDGETDYLEIEAYQSLPDFCKNFDGWDFRGQSIGAGEVMTNGWAISVRGADFGDSSLGISFKNADCRDAKFVSLRFSNIDFTGARLKGAQFNVLGKSEINSVPAVVRQFGEEQLLDENGVFIKDYFKV